MLPVLQNTEVFSPITAEKVKCVNLRAVLKHCYPCDSGAEGRSTVESKALFGQHLVLPHH